MNKPSGTFPSKFGDISYSLPTSAFAVLHGDIKVNGVCYSMSFRVAVKDGRWTQEDWHEPCLRRKQGEPTTAAREGVRNTLLPLWANLLQEKPEMLYQADVYDAESKLKRAEDHAAEVGATLDKARQEVLKQKDRLADLLRV